MDSAAAAASSLGHVAGAANTPDATPAAGSALHDTTGGARNSSLEPTATGGASEKWPGEDASWGGASTHSAAHLAAI